MKVKKAILKYLLEYFKINSQKYIRGEEISSSLDLPIEDLKSSIRYFQEKELVEVIWPTGDLPILRLTSKGVDFVEKENDSYKNINDKKVIKILFLAANPKDTTSLELNKEIKKISQVIQMAKYRDQFDLEREHAINIDELQELILRFEPTIIHFSGHGSEDGAIILEQDNNSKKVSPEALTNFFKRVNEDNKNIQCVLLNACYSRSQAKAIGKHIPCVIGMSTAISDIAAISFSTGFYRAIANGRSIKNAFNLALSNLDLHDIPEVDTPKLEFRMDVIPDKIFLIKP